MNFPIVINFFDVSFSFPILPLFSTFKKMKSHFLRESVNLSLEMLSHLLLHHKNPKTETVMVSRMLSANFNPINSIISHQRPIALGVFERK